MLKLTDADHSHQRWHIYKSSHIMWPSRRWAGIYISVEVLMQVAGLESAWLHEVVVQINTATGGWLELLHEVVRILGSSDFLVMSDEIPDYEVTYPKLL